MNIETVKLPKIKFEDVYKIKSFLQKLKNIDIKCFLLLYLNEKTKDYKFVFKKRISDYNLINIDGFDFVGIIYNRLDDFNKSCYRGIYIFIDDADKHNFKIISEVENLYRSKLDSTEIFEGIRSLFKETYELDSPYIVKTVWDEEVDLLVKDAIDQKIEPGDEVTWIDELDVNWKLTYGIGPFNILELKNDPSLGKLAVVSQKVQGKFTVPLSLLKI